MPLIQREGLWLVLLQFGGYGKCLHQKFNQVEEFRIARPIGVLSGTLCLQFLLFGYAFAMVISIGSVLQEELTYKRYNDWQDVARLVSYCFLEHFPYRQLHMIWRLQGLWQYLRGDLVWRPMKRQGLPVGEIP